MSEVLGNLQVVTIDGDSLTGFVNSTTFTRTAEALDVTTAGRAAKKYLPGMKDGTASLEGVYDTTTVTGPGAILKPLIGQATPVLLVWRPEGTGSGKEESEVSVIVTSFEQTAPVADYVKWTAEIQFVDAVDDTPQT